MNPHFRLVWNYRRQLWPLALELARSRPRRASYGATALTRPRRAENAPPSTVPASHGPAPTIPGAGNPPRQRKGSFHYGGLSG
ncbi:ESPR-type extended signal peptide-containing protein [Alkalilimnicola sp. S0819]|uniref:ESPR-type extended signal peptide-containing protein n=1 Tax=Alkalilimnicola sp. S0819 TaxID=2613922 RepID=UPI001D02CBC0